MPFVILYEGGGRDFFYRELWIKTADTMLGVSDMTVKGILESKVVRVSDIATAYPPTEWSHIQGDV